MTARTYEEFLLRATGQEVPLYFASFHASEVAKSSLRKSMGTEHELRDCNIYTATLLMRVASCFINSMFQAYAQDWIDDPEPNSAGSNHHQPTYAAGNAAGYSFRAVKYFGAQVSLQREAAIRDFLVANRRTNINDALFDQLAATFNDGTFTAERGAMSVAIGDDEPRMVTAGGSVKFDAPEDSTPLVLKVRNIELSESTTGDVHEIELPADVETATDTTTYQVRNVAIWRRSGLNGDGDRVDTEVEGNRINNFLTVSVATFNSLDNANQQPAGRAHLTGDNADRFTFIGYNIEITRKVIPVVEDE